MKKLLLVIPILLILCGCAEDNKKCIKSHTELKIMYYPTSNGQIKQYMMPYAVCDEWEENK